MRQEEGGVQLPKARRDASMGNKLISKSVEIGMAGN